MLFLSDVEADLLTEAERMLASGDRLETAAERAVAAAGGAVQRLQAKLLTGAAQHDPAAMVLAALLLTLVRSVTAASV